MKQKTLIIIFAFYVIGGTSHLLAPNAFPIFNTLYAQDSGASEESEEEEAPSRWQRFIAIFSPKDQVEEDSIIDLTVVKGAGEGGVTEKYGTLYNLIHHEEQLRYQSLKDSGYIDWEKFQRIKLDAKYVSPDNDTAILARNIKVFGWHPHWMGQAYQSYSFNLLSHVALFSYNINVGDGELPYDNPDVIEGWKSEEFTLPTLAHESGCKVLITLTNFGSKENRIFLDNRNGIQEKLILDLKNLLATIDADGVDIDFELIPKGYEKKLSDFIRKLREELTGQGKPYMISMVLPKVNRYNIYNIDTLQNYVDLFVITGYDFAGGFSNSPGPIAPLYSKEGNTNPYTSIEDIVFNYLEDGLERKKLLLGVPYYGGQWLRTKTQNGQPDTTEFKHLTYRNIRDRFGNRAPSHIQPYWSAIFFSQTDPTDTTQLFQTETIWFDDSLTLSKKYDWVLKQGIGGVGIWALGYDNPYTELWSLIDHKFAPTNDTLVVYQSPHKALNIPAIVKEHRNLILIGALFVFLFMIIGFIAALFDWRVRDVFFHNKTLRFLYIVGGFALITGVSCLLFIMNQERFEGLGKETIIILTLVGGLIIGYLLTLNVSKLYQSERNKLP